jgi:hypothetical protein
LSSCQCRCHNIAHRWHHQRVMIILSTMYRWMIPSLSVVTIMSVCNISFVELLLFLFGDFWGICDVNSRNVFLPLLMVLRVPISATLCRRAVLTLLHAFLFLGLRVFPFFFLFLLGGLHCFFFKKCLLVKKGTVTGTWYLPVRAHLIFL